MNKILKIIIGVLITIIIILGVILTYYLVQLSPVSNDKEIINFEVPKGSSGSEIASLLAEKKLIRDENVFKLYLKLNNVDNISYGTYKLNKNMGVKLIVEALVSQRTVNKDIKLLFREGENMRAYAKTIAKYTNNTEENVFELLKDNIYLDSLITKYWFLTDEIKNTQLYYSLEGYLAPNTYNFKNKDVTIEEIFEKMLDQTDKVLTPYKDKILNNDFTIHEFITFASVVESEGINKNDRALIASVFYNRLKINMAFQSCATACYAKKFDGSCSPTNVDTKYKSPYNTYQIDMTGMPVGPISNPGLISIEASLNPSKTDYLYFLSDEHKNTYFFKKYEDHIAKKNELIASGDKVYAR